MYWAKEKYLFLVSISRHAGNLFFQTFDKPFKHKIVIHGLSYNFCNIIESEFNKSISLTFASLLICKVLVYNLINNIMILYLRTPGDFYSCNFTKLGKEPFQFFFIETMRNMAKIDNSTFMCIFRGFLCLLNRTFSLRHRLSLVFFLKYRWKLNGKMWRKLLLKYFFHTNFEKSTNGLKQIEYIPEDA